MSAPQYIALAIGVIAAALVVLSQHGLGARRPPITRPRNARPKEP